jgi:hypothetical protein
MKFATLSRISMFLLAFTALAAQAFATTVESEPLGAHGTDVLAAPTGFHVINPLVNGTNASTVIYDNTASTANAGFSSTDLLATYGDEVTTIGVGDLTSMRFTVFNSGSSAGSLNTATFGISLYNADTAALLGSYSTSVNFGALTPGTYSIVTVTNLDPLLISLNTNHLYVLQTVTAKTGAASRLGIASLNPVTVGSSPNYMYINATTVGAAGFYNLSVPANPGYQLSVIPPPVDVKNNSWGALKALYR